MIRTLYQIFFVFIAAITLHSCFAVFSPVHAEGLGVTCSRGNCAVFNLPSADTKIIHVPAPIYTQAEGKRVREWLRVCDPQVEVDDLGVERLVYARPGCDVGAPR